MLIWGKLLYSSAGHLSCYRKASALPKTGWPPSLLRAPGKVLAFEGMEAGLLKEMGEGEGAVAKEAPRSCFFCYAPGKGPAVAFPSMVLGSGMD